MDRDDILLTCPACGRPRTLADYAREEYFCTPVERRLFVDAVGGRQAKSTLTGFRRVFNGSELHRRQSSLPDIAEVRAAMKNLIEVRRQIVGSDPVAPHSASRGGSASIAKRDPARLARKTRKQAVMRESEAASREAAKARRPLTADEVTAIWKQMHAPTPTFREFLAKRKSAGTARPSQTTDKASEKPLAK